MAITPRERVLSVLSHQSVDRPPVAVFTQSATIKQMERTGVFWPMANYDPEMMAILGSEQRRYGFESVRAPFCISVEAERLGCKIVSGDMQSTPMVVGHSLDIDPFGDSFEEQRFIDPDDFISSGRPKVVIDAIEMMSKRYGEEYPVIAGVTGPATLAGHLISVERFAIGSLLVPHELEKLVAAVCPICKEYSSALSDAGADVIQMSEGVASPEIIDPSDFYDLSGKYLEKYASSMKNSYFSLHICGNADRIIDMMVSTGADCLSIEERSDLDAAISSTRGKAVVAGNIGSVSPLLLGNTEDCRKSVEAAICADAGIIAPGCGLSPLTGDENLEEMVRSVKYSHK